MGEAVVTADVTRVVRRRELGCWLRRSRPSSSAQSTATLRIDRFLLGDTAHLELAVLDREGEAALDQVERVLAELLIAPARQDVEVLADARGERLELVRTGDQPRRDAGFLGTDLEQQLEQVADQRARPWSGPAAWARGRASRRASSGLARLDRGHQARADIVGLPAGRQSANAAEIVLASWADGARSR